jgi:uncharacterized phage-associated protein
MAVEFQFDFDRMLAAMVYIAAQKPRALDMYKMCKLIFLADKLHLVRYSRPITFDKIKAMEFGPVPSNTYDFLKALLAKAPEAHLLAEYLAVDSAYQYPRISMIQPLDFPEYLSRSDMRALDEVVELHGNKTFPELYNLTHEMPAWKKAWNNPERTANNPPMAFEDLFEDDSEAIAGAKSEMVENFEIQQAVVDAAF